MKSRNPVLAWEYHFPDGEPHYVNGEVFVYPSCDKEADQYCSGELYVVHSRNLCEWRVEGPVFRCEELDWPTETPPPAGLMEAKSYRELPDYLRRMLPKAVTWLLPFRLYQRMVLMVSRKISANDGRRLLFAPDALTKDGRSALFFCTSDGCEGVAFAESPSGPFQDPVRIMLDRSGSPITGIDPAVFQDDDGKVYLYWGQIHSCGAQLTEDLTKVKEDTMVCDLVTEAEHGFHEGSSMRKIGDTYYYIFADSHRGKPTALGYATSKSPLGPFTYQGIIVDNEGCDPQTWNNHGSIECVDGQWYVFYHRSTGNSRFMRRMCAEPITIDEKGRISEVPVTSIGMGEPYKAGETLPGYQACKVSANTWIKGDKLMIKKGKAEVVYRYVDTSEKDFQVVYEGSGKACLEHRIDKKGELTIVIDAAEEMEITGFRLERK